MENLLERLEALPAEHREALRWFSDRRDQVISWPEPLAGGLFLASKAKGIYKPAGWTHALSVRQNLRGPYADREIVHNSDGSWVFEYYQEGQDPTRRDDDFTNRALLANRDDRIPVAVMIQTQSNPTSRYRVYGLAMVDDWAGGYFRLRGFSNEGLLQIPAASSATDQVISAVSAIPENITDARKRINSAIVARQGSGRFRSEALKVFGQRCVLSDCDVVDALEAAHIVPYLGQDTDIVTNSFLLRADLHTLFDRELLTIDPETFVVRLAPALEHSSYSQFDGKRVRLPIESSEPWRISLRKRYARLPSS